MVMFISTGLLWSAFQGSMLADIASENPTFGYPLLQQKPPTSDVSEMPWATRQLEAPTSEGEHAQHHGGGAVRYTNDSQMTIAQLEKKSMPRISLSHIRLFIRQTVRASIQWRRLVILV